MVSRLIKQKNIRTTKEYLCQLYTHTPTTRKLTSRSSKIFTRKTKSCQRTFYLCFIVFPSHHHITLMLCCEAFNQVCIAFAFIVCTFSHLLLHLLQACFYLCCIRKCFTCLLFYCCIIGKFHYLW